MKLLQMILGVLDLSQLKGDKMSDIVLNNEIKKRSFEIYEYGVTPERVELYLQDFVNYILNSLSLEELLQLIILLEEET